MIRTRLCSESKILAFVVLGAIFIFNGTVWCLVLVIAASVLSAHLRQNRPIGTVLERLAGVLFIGLGIRLATTK
jgi:threonine/homoserine/homoserine lactone efflux protein